MATVRRYLSQNIMVLNQPEEIYKRQNKIEGKQEGKMKIINLKYRETIVENREKRLEEKEKEIEEREKQIKEREKQVEEKEIKEK